ncbi:hypothetical protein OIO90_005081 [Microbotryomycetes sp. JL221]|nr:hypothetical protein OIO90_005081 [Microbotryomycetes sp. JL221]
MATLETSRIKDEEWQEKPSRDEGSHKTAFTDSASDSGATTTNEPQAVTDQTKAGDVPSDVIYLEWEANDPDNPYNWGGRKKWTTTWINCIFTLLTAFTGSAFAMGTDSMMAELDCSLELATLALSAFPLGFGLAPLVLAPLSEVYGRWPVYTGSCFVYMMFFLPMALGPNIASVIVARFINGLAGSTGSTLVGGSVADLFEARDRGTGIGPAVMGWVEQKLGWRWIHWIQMIMAGVLLLAIIFLTHETRGSAILSKRAARMRKETGDNRYQCRSDVERASLVTLVKVSLLRPLTLLCTEATVASFSLFIAFGWGIMYLSLRAVPLVYGNLYGFSIGQIGLVFLAIVVGGFIGYGTNYYQEHLYRKYHAIKGPEARLYAAMAGGVIFPIGTLIFAFASGRGHWMGPTIGLVLVFLGIFTMYLATFSYLADVYSLYASSAMSGQSLCRNLFGFAFPMFTDAMYRKLTYQWASFLAACLGLLLAAVPFVLYRFGPKIRQHPSPTIRGAN